MTSDTNSEDLDIFTAHDKRLGIEGIVRELAAYMSSPSAERHRQNMAAMHSAVGGDHDWFEPAHELQLVPELYFFEAIPGVPIYYMGQNSTHFFGVVLAGSDRDGWEWILVSMDYEAARHNGPVSLTPFQDGAYYGGRGWERPEKFSFEYPTNWRENFEGVLQTISLVEGKGWLDNEMRKLTDPRDGENLEYSAAAALKCFERFEPESEEDDSFGRTVYGSGGGNRWIFRYNGDVELSGYQAVGNAEYSARKLGFTVC